MGRGKRQRRRDVDLQRRRDEPRASWGQAPPYWVIPLLVGATFAVYLNTLQNEFVFDDQVWILAPDKIKHIRGTAFRVVVHVSYLLDHAISGWAPWGYHLTNIAYHAVAAVFVFLIARTLFDRTRPATITALLFAIHPIQTESVAFLSGRRDVLSGLFIFVGFYAFLRYRQTARWFHLGGAFLAYLAAFFSKESAGILPLLWFSYDAISQIHARLNAPGAGASLLRAIWAGSWTAFRRGLALYLSLSVLAAALAFYVMVLVPGTWKGASYHGGSLWFTLLTDARIFCHYLKLLVFPLTLNVDYSYNAFPVTTSWSDPRALGATLILAGLGYGALRLLKTRPIAPLGAAWFLVGLLPSAHIFPLYEMVAEHYLYVPSAGFFLAVVALVDPLLDRPRLAPALYATGLTALLLLSLRTVRRNLDWKDELTLWRSAVAAAPEAARARNNLASAHLHRRELSPAQEQLEAALRITPHDTAAHANLGMIYLKRGELALAENELTLALRLRRNPDTDALVRLRLGQLYAQMGRLPEAEQQLRAAARNPGFAADAYNELGGLLARSGRLDEARSAFLEAIRRRPDWAEPRESLYWATFRDRPRSQQAPAP